MGDRVSIKDVFVQCQTGLQGHGKLMKTLHKIYDKTEFEAFWSEFQHYLKYAMIVFKREPAVERMIDFVAKFAPTLCKKVTEKGGDEEEEGVLEEDSVADNRFLQEMFDFLLNSHSARERGVRFRCCQLINKLLTNLGEDAQIDDDLYDRLYECMLERLKDKCPMVRYHAVLAMARLQDPADDNCPVIKAYLFLLNCDPNADVRRAVLSSIAPSTKTLASIIGRTRDVKDTVRKTAYEVLAEKIHIRALSIASRLQLINEGLNDRSELVQQACSGKLLQAWMRTVGGDILDLLRSLDVEDSTDVCSRVLETLFKASSLQDMMASFNILDEKLLVPAEALNSESALYWQAVCKFIHTMGTDGDEYMETVMPTVVDFCAFMQRYVDDLRTVEDPEIQLGREFIIEQLLLITSYMDTADVASKKALETLLHNMLMADYVSHRLVKFIIVQICTLRGNGENLVPYFAETVSEIREPITVVEKDIEEEQKRQINLKIAGIRVQLNQLREDLDTAVKGQNFEEAAAIKTVIAQLDAEKNELLETSEPVREEVRTEKNDAFTLLKCQTIMSEMLQQLKLSNVSPTLQMMIESQIVPGIQNEDAEVRNMAMQALGLCCYLSKDLLVTYIPLFMQASQIDVEGVRVTALQILFDLLLIYGLEIVDASEGSSNESVDNAHNVEGVDAVISETASSSSDSRNGTASKLVAIICSFLDGESSDLRTCAAEGLSKLLLSGRVVSSKILSHLILLWYNPLSEDDTHLRDCLGTFFPLYALASRCNQEVVEEAFVPTLRTLLNAPATSPLAEVDVNNVAELLVQLTNTKLLTANRNNTEISLDNRGHDNLSETVCNEILSKPDSTHVKLWVRILNQMDVSPDNEVVLKDLRILAYKMSKTVKEKLSVKGLQKFQDRINELASKFVTDNNDLENIEIEPVMPTTESADEVTETAAETPKRKRVRGLYSHNMTLAMESESELDIADDSTVEVDASCLMSRTSVETPSRRSRKNTTTAELADEDVFIAPNEPPTSASEVAADTGIETDRAVEDLQVSESDRQNEGYTEEEKTTRKNKSTRSKSPDKRGRPSVKKAISPKKTGHKSPENSQDKRKASSSPKGVSPEKRIASESPARRSQEKRKASKSPAIERKRMSKSPARSESSGRRGSGSPDKRKSSESPIKEAGERRMSKSGVKSPERRNECKSPARGNTEKRKSPASPARGNTEKRKSSASPARGNTEKRKSPASPARGNTEKRKSPASPARGNTEKRKSSASPARGNTEKRKSPASPARGNTEKRKSPASPARGNTEKRKSSASPARGNTEKRKSPASPARGNTEKRKSSASPARGNTEKRKSSASPARGNTEKRKSSASPAKASGGKDDKASPAPAKKTKENEKASVPKSKVSSLKKISKVQKPEKTKASVKLPGKTKSGMDEEQKRNEKLKQSHSPERKKIASKVPDKNGGKAVERNVRNAMPKSVDTGRTRATTSSSQLKSPRPAGGVKPGASRKVSSTNSPKPGGKAGMEIVADTPEPVSRIATRSLLSTPDTGSPRGKGTPKAKSVAETPEHAVTQKPQQKKTAPISARGNTARSTAAKPVVMLTDVKATHGKASSRTPRTKVSSASESSPEKSATRAPRPTRGKIASSDDLSASSPDSAKQSRQKKGKASPVGAVETTTDEDEEDVSLKRKAKPSRRSHTSASASTSMMATPPVAGRTTRSSLSQSSLNSPASGSPRQRRLGVPGTKISRKGQPVAGKQADGTASPRTTRADGSSQGSSTLSLISSQRTTVSSQRSTASSGSEKRESSQSSRVSSRTSGTTTASTRSKSTDSAKTAKVAAPGAKVTRSAVATKVTRDTRPEPGKLKRPLRSKPSDRR